MKALGRKASLSYTTRFSKEKVKDWSPNTHLREGDNIRATIFQVGKVEVQVEYISQRDLHKHLEQDLHEQKRSSYLI